MTVALFTLYEGDYHRGVGAFVNSAIRSGFRGTVFIGYRDYLPPWVANLCHVEGERYVVGECELHFFRCDPPRHLAYHKPFAALDLLDAHADVDAIFYADPDIVFLASWSFFENWTLCGVALCEDCNFDRIGTHHPWRAEWRSLIESAGFPVVSATDLYPNGGFFGVRREDRSFLATWKALINTYAESGADMRALRLEFREEAIVSDQDLLAASLMASDRIVSLLGREGMGFGGHYFILSHATERPKPWQKTFTFEAMKGTRPSRASVRYLWFVEHPIRVMGAIPALILKADMWMAKGISRIWKR